MNAQTAVEQLLADFARLDLDGMMGAFTEDATAFFPVEYAIERLEGRAAIHDGFAGVIARARARGLGQLSLIASEMRSVELGDAALVTVHLSDAPFGRRTFVLRREGERWRVLHLHASNAAG